MRDDSGQVLVLVIVIAVTAILLGIGALAYALNANGQSAHDQRTRGAQQASDTGVQRQLYLNSDSDTVGYNLSGGALGLGTFLDCTVPEVNLGVQIGTVQVAAGSAGVCPTSCTSATSCTSGPPGSGGWQPLGNGNYYESEFFANGDDVGTAGTGNADAVQFPEIVSIGCHTTATTNPQSSCASGGAGNSYSRQLDVLEPTGPLQSAEANNDLTINASTSTLTSSLTTSLTSLFNSTCTTALGIVISCSGLTGVLSGVLNLVTGLLGLDTVGQLVSTTLGDGVGVVDGNITAGNNLYLPGLTVDANTTSGSPDLQLGTLASVFESAVGALSYLSGVSPVFEYGKYVCSEGSGSKCLNKAGGLSDATPVAAIAPTYVQSSGACAAGTPSSSCTVARPTFAVTSALTAATTSGSSTIPTGTALSGTGASATYVDGDLTLKSGTLTFGAGSYVFCSVYAASGTTLTTSGGTQIYIAPPGSSDCPTSSSAPGYLAPGSTGYLQLGNFVACSGVSNTLSGSGGLNLDTASGVVNPSSLQIYDAGVDEYSGGTTALAAGSTDTAVSSSTCPNTTETYGTGTGKYAISTNDPATQVYIGTSSNSLTESMIVYAPQSEVTINTTGAFEGSAVGFNVDLTALAVLQDLDLGNYPISTVANAYQVAQVIQCDNTIEALSNTESGNPDQFATTGTASSGGAGDLNGCAN